MSYKLLALFLIVFLPFSYSYSQQDSTTELLQDLPKKYFSAIDKKAEKYSSRITGKTEKTLQKLSRWENKIHTLLEKVSPDASAKLFAPGQPTFTSLLAKYKEGEAIGNSYKASYDQYRDQLTTQLKYLDDKKQILDEKYRKPLEESRQAIKDLDTAVQNSEALEQFIKERKKQLMQEGTKYLGKSKYLQKINKESFYYTETLRNYKEIFNDKQKAEETALTLLNKIPLFQKFMRENGELASLFGSPGGSNNIQNLAGLQTRASVNAIMQTRIASGGPNAMQTIQSNMQQAQAELSKLKDKILKAGGGNSGTELPDFKPNMQKTKTFAQRLDYGFDFQSVKNTSFVPAAYNLGLSIGYKINDKSVAGLGASYKLGIGSIDKIHFSHEGIGLRSFMDWKLKKQFFVSGGFEMNHLASFKNFAALQNANLWQQSGLLGISKKIAVKSKFTKGGKLQLMYDFLWKEQVPVGQQWVFRLGYKL